MESLVHMFISGPFNEDYRDEIISPILDRPITCAYKVFLGKLLIDESLIISRQIAKSCVHPLKSHYKKHGYTYGANLPFVMILMI